MIAGLYVDTLNLSNEKGNFENFKGYGEVGIGSLVWKKIKFEVQLNADSETVLCKPDEM